MDALTYFRPLRNPNLLTYLLYLSILPVCWAVRCPGSPENLEKIEVLQGVTPYGNTSAGTFTRLSGIIELQDCILECCRERSCHVTFFFQDSCFLVNCVSELGCQPFLRNGNKFQKSYMAQLRPVIQQADIRDLPPRREELLNNHAMFRDLEESGDDPENGMFLSGPALVEKKQTIGTRTCEVGIEIDCYANEYCIPKNSRSRSGICTCQRGFARSASTGHCVSIERLPNTNTRQAMDLVGSPEKKSHPDTHINEPEMSTTASYQTESDSNISAALPLSSPLNTSEAEQSESSTSSTSRHLVVSAGETKVVQLPENEVSISAYAVPEETKAAPYKYQWNLVSHPTDGSTGSMANSNSKTLKLTGLKEGLYTFRVNVSGEGGAYGEALVNVTVLPPKRVNKPPVAIINPANQTVKLPTSETVLDGSSSTDDDKIVSYTWETVTAPIEYKPRLTDTATLELKDLIPGIYRFMLTVKDSDDATNSTIANVTVIKEMDYQPTANAGPDIIIYLPQTNVTLNGNLSTDDKGIKSWEWTKASADIDKAVDMQDSHTPFLKLSHLEVGMYTFVLKVTDTADQTGSSEVHVFVKPGNEGPTADAGKDQSITLPISTVELDGSASTDDVGISQYEWQQISGPSNSKIENPDQQKTKVSSLTRGVYIFQLSVYDDKKTKNSKNVTITVNPSKNDPPRANAGGDRTVQLPFNMVLLNGSQSSDDSGIVSYEWARDPTSLAAGDILQGTDHSPVLMIANLIPGRYLFKLTVTDNEGSSDSDSASIIVKESPHANDDIEIIIGADITTFSEDQKITLAKKLALLLHEEGETFVRVNKVDSVKDSGRVLLVFNVEKTDANKDRVMMPGVEAVRKLKEKLRMDLGLLDVNVLYIDTVVCQNPCSGHGVCNQLTKKCICDAFWMQNPFNYYMGDHDSNCDWSILYVTVVSFILMVAAIGILWGITCFCNRLRMPKSRRRSRYVLLDEDKESMQMLPKASAHQSSSLMISESDTDSDTLFENGAIKHNSRTSNGALKSPPNGIVRNPRKIRT